VAVFFGQPGLRQPPVLAIGGGQTPGGGNGQPLGGCNGKPLGVFPWLWATAISQAGS